MDSVLISTCLGIVVLGFLCSSSSAATHSMGMTMGRRGDYLQGMGDDCVLSFVVPRDKMKSSCDMSDKIKRRLNGVEMKVNMYKQQIGMLQAQLDKERRVNAASLQRLESQMLGSTVQRNWNDIMQQRMDMLVADVNELRDTVSIADSNARSGGHPNDFHEMSHFNSYNNAVDNSNVKLANLVRTMVEDDVKKVFDKFTRNYEKYVREQIMLYDQLFSLHREQQDSPARRDDGSLADDPWRDYKTPKKQQSRSQRGGDGGGLSKETKKVNSDLDKTMNDAAKKVVKVLDKSKAASKSGDANDGHSPKADAPYNKPSYKAVDKNNSINSIDSEAATFIDDGLESNDSYSGENPDSNETLSEDMVTRVIEAATTGKPGVVSSRIGSGKGNVTAADDPLAEMESRWMNNKIGDDTHTQTIDQKRLRDEIRAVLYDSLTKMREVVNKRVEVVEEKADVMEDKLARQESLTNKKAEELKDQMKNVNQSVQSHSLQMKSLTKGLQDTFQKAEAISRLEFAIKEITKNLSKETEGISAIELDHRDKKIKKLERLMNVYHQSLDHYKNETKHEYSNVKVKLGQNKQSIKALGKNLRNEMTSQINRAIEQEEKVRTHAQTTYDQAIQEVRNDIFVTQMDIEDIETKLREKKNKVSRDLKEVKDTLKQVVSRNRDCRKNIGKLEKKHAAVGDLANRTATTLGLLKTEVQLNHVDAWIKIAFDYDISLSACFGDQYIKRVDLTNSKTMIVGVVLCSATRYKIFLAKSIEDTFSNVGDAYGHGEDHCEFVGADYNKRHQFTTETGNVFTKTEGYRRSKWGDVPTYASLNGFIPCPLWYECLVSIP